MNVPRINHMDRVFAIQGIRIVRILMDHTYVIVDQAIQVQDSF